MARQAIRADGLGDTIRAFKLFAPELVPVAQEKLLQVAEIAARAAVRRMPRPGGTRTVTDPNGKKRVRPKGNQDPDHIPARDSVVVKKSGKANVVIQGGTTRAEGQHFGWLDFGGTINPTGKSPIKRRVVKGGRYIYPAAADNADRMTDAIESALDTITRKLDLD